MSLGTIGIISSFQRNKCDAFYWKINEISSRKGKKGEFYYSPDFDFKGNLCDLKFYPDGKSSKTRSGFFGLYFRSRDCNKVSYAHLKLGMKTRGGMIETVFSQNIFFSLEEEFGAPALSPLSEFFKRNEDLVPSDCLTFVVHLGPADEPEKIRDFVEQTEIGKEEEKDDEEKEGFEKVAWDMAKLLTSEDRSDATIVVDEAEFKVHSCILAARIPVFAALFEHDTIEKATRKVNITDCEPAIFKEFLNYVYMGKVQNLTAESSLDLYRVADKYLVKELKKVCRQCIQDNLSPETFCEAAQLALRCGDEDLLACAIDYYAKNIRLIVRSAEWLRYLEENPREANDILVRSLGPP